MVVFNLYVIQIQINKQAYFQNTTQYYLIKEINNVIQTRQKLIRTQTFLFIRHRMYPTHSICGVNVGVRHIEILLYYNKYPLEVLSLCRGKRAYTIQ